MSPRVIYLGGFSRSGTTLLQRMLGRLPGVVSLGETCNLWDTSLENGDLCTCGQPIPSCAFWCKVGRKAFGGWEKLDLGEVKRLREAVDRMRFLPFLLHLGHSGRFNELACSYAQYYVKLYAAAGEVSGARVIVDSSKRASLACCLCRVEGLDLRLIHVVRDSRGVAYSCTKEVARPDSPNGGFMGTASPTSTSASWVVQNLALEILRKKGVSVHLLTYERFMEDPMGSLQEIATFAGLTADGPATEFLSEGHVQLGTGHNIGGNPMRAHTGRVPLRLDDAWRTDLSRVDRALVSVLTYPLLRHYSRK